MLLEINTMAILVSLTVFLLVIILLVIVLLVAKRYLVASGNVKITINGDKEFEVPAGGMLLSTMADVGVFLPSACGGKARVRNANAKYLTVVVKFCRPKRCILPENR